MDRCRQQMVDCITEMDLAISQGQA